MTTETQNSSNSDLAGLSHNEIVFELIEAWNTMDIDKIMSFFNDDAIYTNIPIDPPNKGTAAIREAILGFLGMSSEIEFIVHHQSENAHGVVMNERLDRFLINDNWIELPVMGVFEFSEGKISAWRDYFDMGQFSSQS